MDRYLEHYRLAMDRALATCEITDQQGRNLPLEAGLQQLCALTAAAQVSGRTLWFVGNGASAMFASHMALDFTKNGGCRALAFNDPAYLTAIANDIGYPQAFSLPVTWFAQAGDVLVTISSSGNSPNVLAAIEAARARNLQVITFSGMKPDNRSRSAGDLNLYVAARTYGIVECAHQVLLHAWLDRFMNIREWEVTA
jgi:D-sedoheptulose 7-phosphate isomerase